ncbi:transmembrane protein 65 isoform X3 [Bradysia coprophila]|uniref:transmembrane protein 65 isoform X3 n=1 Tax=Bradysia coprophila TaxID=38358 RepID=UPI00187DCF3F|nr:transmembrane protein 65 isoform X3 [Bradysia coprophila]
MCELAASRWRTPKQSNIPGHIEHHQSGIFYETAIDDETSEKLVEAHAVIPPTKDELMKIMIVNAVPFLGFGFLDNFFMIVAGDYIEHTMGMYMCISTMAAAGFGNTISDVLGLGLAHYVERFCEFLGLRPPRLTQEQMELKSSRRVASYGRALGIMIGCLLGMCPLLFMKKRKSDNDAGNESETQKTVKL